MNIDDYQKRSRETAIYSGGLKSIDGLTYAVLALCGEAGELANKLKKNHRAGTPPDADVLADELGDVLWYCAAVAEELNMDLSTVARMNLDKLAIRAARKRITG